MMVKLANEYTAEQLREIEERSDRKQRVDAVKRYFDLRKTQKMINDIPQEPALW
jgi:hypothetical protein